MMATDSRVTLQPAYLIHQRPYRETSALLEVFTPEHGKIGLVARGIKGARGRWRGLLQPFRPLLLSWRGRGGLATLTDAEPSGLALGLSGEQILNGFYLNELLQRLLHRDDPHLELFGAYDHALRRLAALPPAPGAAAEKQQQLRLFEVRLLEAIGYGIILDREAGTGAPISAERLYSYRMDGGPVSWQPEQAGIRVHGRTLQALQQGTLDDEQSRHEARNLLRAMLQGQLGDRPLHSRELVRQVNRVVQLAETGG
ncbi:MAG: DNA repair protein RecO [Gammaproteobacteria bacterium RBG_16_57_12]|nr:MAG: DNA repair protein RecO [Gammaproteobacteria bacterium RBG_16_57_12]